MKTFFLSLILLSLVSCTGVRATLTNPFVDYPPTEGPEAEEYYYVRTKELIKLHVATEQLRECNLDVDTVQRPQVVSVANFADGRFGQYYVQTKIVAYRKDKPQALVHEYMHYFNSLVSDKCRDEFAAYFAAATSRVSFRLTDAKKQNRRQQQLMSLGRPAGYRGSVGAMDP